MTRQPITALCFFLGSTLPQVLADTPGSVDPACVEKINNVALAAWNKAAETENDIEVVCHQQTVTRNPTQKGKEPVDDQSEWKISWSATKKRRIVEREYKNKNNNRHGLHVANNTYKFLVGQLANVDSPNNFELTSASKYELAEDFFKYDPTEESAYSEILNASHQVYFIPLQALLKDADWKLKTARFTDQSTSSDRNVRLEWQCINGAEAWKKTGALAWVELGPDTSWLVSRCGIRIPNEGKVDQKIDYQPYKDGLFPKTVTRNFEVGSSSTSVESFRFDTPQPFARSEAEFYLPFYGISESVVGVTGTNYWVRAGAIGLALLGVAISIYLYRQSNKSPGLKTSR